MNRKVGRPPVGGYGTKTRQVGTVRVPEKVYDFIMTQTCHAATWFKDIAIYKYTKNKEKKRNDS